MGAIFFFFTKVNKTVKSLRAAELECGTFRFSGSQAKGTFSAPLFPTLTLMHSDRRDEYKVTPLWPTPSPSRKPGEKQLHRSYGDLFSEFWKEKGKIGDLQKNHKPF